MFKPLHLVSLALLVTLITSLPVTAQEWAREKLANSPRHLEWVTVSAGSREIETYVAYPENAKKATTVLVIHEIFGHSDWIKLLCDQLAEAGYVAVAPDLLSGMGPEGGATGAFPDVEAVRKAVSGLQGEQVVGDLKAVADYAKNLPASNGKLAVAGFCWGGTQSFRFAAASAQMEISFPFYGAAPDNKALATVSGPVYAFYAENDARVNATLPETEAAMKEFGKTFVPKIYQGAGHGFMRAGAAPDASKENAQAMKDAWAFWLERLRSIETAVR